MNRYALFSFALLVCASMAVHGQTPPIPGLGCTPAAHTFCVTATTDNSSDPAANAGTGTLRQAIIDSNAAGGANTIGFDIPNADPLHPAPQTVTITRQLPAINFSGTESSLLVDGYSQPGSALNTNTPDDGGLNAKLMVEVVGTGGFYGFYYYCCPFPKIGLTYQGMAMHGFAYMIAGQGNGLTPKAQINVYGNFLGTGVDGTALPPGSGNFNAVLIQDDNAQIGGAQAWQRNLISGVGTAISGGTPNDSIVIEGNLVGTDASGTLAIANNLGIDIGSSAPGIRVGCTGAGCTAAGHPSRNVISGNSSLGARIGIGSGSGSSSLEIKGNYIGTDWSGAKSLPNGSSGCPASCAGIWVQQGGTSPPPVIVGGFNAGEANVVAWNNGPGINGPDGRVSESFDNQGNAIHNNRGTDIAFVLNATRIANDPGDADIGTNNQQNYPEIQSANVSGTPGNLTLNVTYLVDSTTGNSTYPLRIDFYVDIDEGSGAYLVSDAYSTPQTLRTVSLPLPANVQALTGFVASATDANGYSSELSPSVVFDRIFADGFQPHF